MVNNDTETNSTTIDNRSILVGSQIEFDFAKIKENLKEFLKSQEEFKDYNFESSGLNILLDVLAYNSHMNAMTAHLSMSELFLQTAQARPNIVSLAKQLGYTPKSYKASSASVDLILRLNPADLRSFPSSFTIPANFRISGGGYTWYLDTEATSTQDIVGSNTYFFRGLTFIQGQQRSVRYHYDTRVSYPKFEIPDLNVDISTIRVRTYQRDNRDIYTEYQLFSDFSSISDRNRPFFIDESPTGYYQVYFSSLFPTPQIGTLVEITYNTCAGEDANSVVSFVKNDTIYNSSETIVCVSNTPSSGGQNKESIESIRKNAPPYYSAQNRCVTLDDYISVINKEYRGIESINVWGGEQNEPPQYGRVYICLKPQEGEFLPESEKTFILDKIVKPRSVASLIPVVIDPDYTYLRINARVRYDVTKTTYTSRELSQIVRNAIIEYTDLNLEKFDRVFRNSNLLTKIDSAEASFRSSSFDVTLIKKFDLLSSSAVDTFTEYPVPIRTHPNTDNYIQTSAFIYEGNVAYLRDYRITTSDTKRELKIITISNDGSVNVLKNQCGEIDIFSRIISLYSFIPDESVTLKMFLIPDAKDLAPYRNQLFSLDQEEMRVTVSIDTIASQGASGAENYYS